jgi:hypothetical protein
MIRAFAGRPLTIFCQYSMAISTTWVSVFSVAILWLEGEAMKNGRAVRRQGNNWCCFWDITILLSRFRQSRIGCDILRRKITDNPAQPC